jgi:hypothetical protein
MRVSRYQLRQIIREQGNPDADMAKWNQLEVGDRIAVESGDYYYEPVEILQKLEDISIEGGSESGLGFVGTDPLGRSGDTIVFPMRDVVQESLTKRQLRVSKHQLHQIIREATQGPPPYVLERSGVGADERFFVEIAGWRPEKIVYGPFEQAKQFSTEDEALKVQTTIDEMDGFYTRIRSVKFFEG